VPFGLAGVATGVLFGVAVNYAAGTRISLEITGCSMREYVRAQVPGAVLGLIAAVVAVTARLALRAAGASPLLVLVGTATAALGAVGAVVYLYPDSVGTYGRGAIRMLADTLRNRHWGRQIVWVDRFSHLLARRWVGQSGAP
jgi:hypothetical protein